MLASVLWSAACIAADSATNSAATISAATDTVILIDGKKMQAKVASIDSNGLLGGEGLPANIPLSEVREISRTISLNEPAVHRVLYLYGGGHLIVKQVTLEDEKCVAHLISGTKLALPMSAVAGVRILDDPKKIGELQNSSDLREAASDPEETGTKDLLFVISTADDRPPKVQRASGVFEKLTADKVEFVWKDKRRVISRDKVFGFALAQVSDPPDLSGHVSVSLVDGSQIWCLINEFKDGKLSIQLPAGVDLSLPWNEVVRLDVRNDRLVFLSDLVPTQVNQQSLVAFPRKWRKNLNVLGQPLEVDKEKFTKGIGVQPRTSLTFSRPDGFDVLAATIGIDAAAKGRGDCEFVVLAGDKELARKRVRGSDSAIKLHVPIADHEKITLLVEAGEDLDLSDYANWCDIRFIKSGK
jgi:hypothetical protein